MCYQTEQPTAIPHSLICDKFVNLLELTMDTKYPRHVFDSRLKRCVVVLKCLISAVQLQKFSKQHF